MEERSENASMHITADRASNGNKYLLGKFALVTGGSRGIGRGIAIKLAEKGANVAINYFKDQKAANDALGKIKQRGSEGFVVQADVSKPDELSAMIRKVR